MMNFKRHILITHGGFLHTCAICRKQVGHFSKTSKEDNLQTLIEKARTSFKTHMIAHHDDGQEGPWSIARKELHYHLDAKHGVYLLYTLPKNDIPCYYID